MKRIVYVSEDRRIHEFAERATKMMQEHPYMRTYSEDEKQNQTEILPGDLLAIRWNACTVLVLKVDEGFNPLLFPTIQFIGSDLPELQVHLGT